MSSVGNADVPADVQALVSEARTAEREARRDVARRRYEAALLRLAGTSHTSVASDLIRWIGRTYLESGDLDVALDCLEAAQAVASAAGNAGGEAHAVNSKGIVHFQRGQLDAAEELYGQALTRAYEAGDLRLAAMIQQNLGNVSNVRGESGLALGRYRAALDGYRVLGLPEYVGPLLNNLGRVHIDLGQWTEAEALLLQASAHAAESGDRSNQVLVEVNRTRLWIGQGDLARAREACEEAYELSRQVEDDRWLGEILMHFGTLFRKIGKLRTAEEYLERAGRVAGQQEDALLVAETSREMAEVFRREGRNRDTLQALNRAHRLFRDLRAFRDIADVHRRLARLEETFLEIVRDWSASIESKDRYTQGHCERVADLACRLALRAGMDPGVLIWFRMGALLHDVGKVAVPSDILNKPGRLTEAEWRVMRRHPEEGVQLLAGVEFPWDVAPMILHHHERWDGTGYPYGLAGTEIPVAARILCVVDVFDALTTDRSYRPAHSRDVALEIMEGDAGHVLDPAMFALFREILEEAEAVAEVRRDPEAPAQLRVLAPDPFEAAFRETGRVGTSHPTHLRAV